MIKEWRRRRSIFCSTPASSFLWFTIFSLNPPTSWSLGVECQPGAWRPDPRGDRTQTAALWWLTTSQRSQIQKLRLEILSLRSRIRSPCSRPTSSSLTGSWCRCYSRQSNLHRMSSLSEIIKKKIKKKKLARFRWNYYWGHFRKKESKVFTCNAHDHCFVSHSGFNWWSAWIEKFWNFGGGQLRKLKLWELNWKSLPTSEDE